MNIVHVDDRVQVDADYDGYEMVECSSRKDCPDHGLPFVFGREGHDEKLCFIAQLRQENHEEGRDKCCHKN